MYSSNKETLVTKLREQHVHLTQNRIAVFRSLTDSKTALSASAITKQAALLNRISVYGPKYNFNEREWWKSVQTKTEMQDI